MRHNEEHDLMKEYETNILHHDEPEDFEGSMVFRHWLEDTNDDYDGSMVFRHWNED